jgi:hypothetical protein
MDITRAPDWRKMGPGWAKYGQEMGPTWGRDGPIVGPKMETGWAAKWPDVKRVGSGPDRLAPMSIWQNLLHWAFKKQTIWPIRICLPTAHYKDINVRPAFQCSSNTGPQRPIYGPSIGQNIGSKRAQQCAQNGTIISPE